MVCVVRQLTQVTSTIPICVVTWLHLLIVAGAQRYILNSLLYTRAAAAIAIASAYSPLGSVGSVWSRNSSPYNSTSFFAASSLLIIV